MSRLWAGMPSRRVADLCRRFVLKFQGNLRRLVLLFDKVTRAVPTSLRMILGEQVKILDGDGELQVQCYRSMPLILLIGPEGASPSAIGSFG
jgi:hypothetical protein